MNVITLLFQFPGLISEGSCFLTVGYRENGPVVIICSQKRNYHGTSITNAIEVIATKLRNDVLTKALDDHRPVFERLRDIWKDHQTAPLHQSFGDKTVVLVEHYPAGTGVSMGDSFMEIRFDEFDSPHWMRALRRDMAGKAFGDDIVRAAVNAQ